MKRFRQRVADDDVRDGRGGRIVDFDSVGNDIADCSVRLVNGLIDFKTALLEHRNVERDRREIVDLDAVVDECETSGNR